jgi:FkbM family methyltransferase
MQPLSVLTIRAQVLAESVPITMEVPDRMRSAVKEVLAGEYESGFSGENLTVLDIGANVGAFTLWADLRWPGSVIHAYEPHPETFQILSRNVRGRSDVKLNNVALWPTKEATAPLFSRYAGDGEAGLTYYMRRTFNEMSADRICQVAVLHPGTLPHADVIKLDVEGAEWEILKNLDSSKVSLILLEFQNDENRRAIKKHLAGHFTLECEDCFAWADILHITPLYRRDLKDDHYGRLLFANRTSHRLRRVGDTAKRRRFRRRLPR